MRYPGPAPARSYPVLTLDMPCVALLQVAPRVAVRAAAQASVSSSFAGARLTGKAARQSARRAAVAAQAKVSALPAPAPSVAHFCCSLLLLGAWAAQCAQQIQKATILARLP